jgi:hypothetical protein
LKVWKADRNREERNDTGRRKPPGKEIEMIIDNGVESYIGCVYGRKDHWWLDGMLEVFAEVWDSEKHESKMIQVGYYGADNCNLTGRNSKKTIDF